MQYFRTSRYVAALVALISLLFMQLAVAAYACPDLQPRVMDDVPDVALHSTIQHGEKCTGVDSEQPGLCHAHEQAGEQSLDKPAIPEIQPFFAAGLALPLLPLDVAYRPFLQHSTNFQLARITAPPLSIQHCCFRI